MSSVNTIIKSGLCHGCGTCVAVCPTNAINIEIDRAKGVFEPRISVKHCNDCGLCVKVCPGAELDFEALNQDFFGGQPSDPWLGVSKRIVIAYAKDEKLRHEASSGGVLSALLAFMLETKIIGGAVVARMKKDSPLETEAFIARSADEVFGAKGSKYCPVCIADALKEIVHASENERFAVVGLPCHLHGIRKFMLLKPKLKERIPYLFGLMCSNNNTFIGTEYFLNRKGIEPESVASVSYRGHGWPGEISIKLKNGEKVNFNRKVSGAKEQALRASAFHHCFAIPRCLTCCDHNAELSDISFGDPRYPDELKNEKSGKTLLVCRNAKSVELLEKAIFAGKIVLHRDMPEKEFYSGQDISFKREVGAHLKVRKILGLAVPEYKTTKDFSIGFRKGLIRVLTYLPSYIPRKLLCWPVLWFYSFFMRVISRYIG